MAGLAPAIRFYSHQALHRRFLFASTAASSAAHDRRASFCVALRSPIPQQIYCVLFEVPLASERSFP
jgi:hypothetical protein